MIDMSAQAHTIRNSASKQSQAICALKARFRWCMSATPIQNNLEDLGALIKFLKVPILEETPMFREHIIAPIEAGTKGCLTNLRRLLEALCVRRTKSMLELSDSNTETQSW
jgi:SNF2 family DNA or RNA helicase